MANTFGILAAVALLFGAFVSFKNKSYLEKVDSSIDTENSNKTQNTATFDALVEDIAELEEEKGGYDTTKEETQAKLDEQETAIADAKKKIASMKSEANAAMVKANDAEEKLKELGPLDELIPEMKALEIDITQLEDDISENSAVVDRLQDSKNVSTAKAKALAEQLAKRTRGTSYFESTSVRSVFRQWGFVTLAGGDNIGVVKKSKLSVLRGGEEIAQLIVTGVEPNSAAANIIPSSVKGDQTVSPGDKVVPLQVEEKKAAVAAFN
ncbi:hypothetical protein N9224_01095 [Akkermansiaceae bacterium]|nr:hypothetical protein [Akkermansiaceae bacterium]